MLGIILAYNSIWGRGCCINGDLQIGSMIPYILKAKAEGYSILIMNPDMHYDSLGQKIKYHEDMHAHCRYVWETIVQLSPAKSLYIASHSAGGYCAHKLITRFGISRIYYRQTIYGSSKSCSLCRYDYGFK